MATDRPGRYSNCQSKRKTPADVLTSSSRPTAQAGGRGLLLGQRQIPFPPLPLPLRPQPTTQPPSGHVKDKFGARPATSVRGGRVIRSGEGRGGGRLGRGRGEEGERMGGGEAAAGPVRESPPPPRQPGRTPRPRRLRPGERAHGLCASAPGAPRFRVERPQPRPRPGEGAGLCVRAETREAHPRAPGPGVLTFIPRERAGRGTASWVRTSARLNCSWKGWRAPLAGKCPRRPRRGWGRGRLRASDISGIPDASPESGMPLRLTP